MTDNSVQLDELRERVRELRIAKKWLQEYRINAPTSISQALGNYHRFLTEQEVRTIEMGKRIKNGL